MVRTARVLAFLAAALALGAPRAAWGEEPKPDPKADAEQALVEQDPKVSAALAKMLSDANVQVRRAVIAALAARTEADAKKEAASALLARTARLVQYADLQDELIAVFGALHDLALPTIVRPLADGIDLERREPAILEARLRAIANVPTAEAITSLIDVMAKGGKANSWWKGAVRDALVYATGEKLKPEADAWRKWWTEHGKDFDFAAAAARRAKERGAKKK